MDVSWTIKKAVKWSEVAQLCPTLCDPMDCSLPGSSVHGIFLARVLKWIDIFYSRGSSQPRDWTRVSCIAGGCFTLWAKRRLRENQRLNAFKLWCWKTIESPLDWKIQPVNPKRNQSWVFIGRSDAKVEALIIWLPNAKADSLEKFLMLGKNEGRRRRGQKRVRWLYDIATQWTWVWTISMR